MRRGCHGASRWRRGWTTRYWCGARMARRCGRRTGIRCGCCCRGSRGTRSIKWVRRLELSDQPNMSKDETSKYTDPIPGSKARQFSFLMDVKSVITSPAYPQQLTERGWWPIRGLAWTGRGRIAKVEVSTDGGKSWQQARLEGNNLPLAPVRFEQMWKWDGNPAVLLSRATDETGAVQPTRSGVPEGCVASAPTTTSATSGDGASAAMAWCGTRRTREARGWWGSCWECGAVTAKEAHRRCRKDRSGWDGRPRRRK